MQGCCASGGVREKRVSAEHAGNLDQLIVIVVAVKEWLTLEDERGEHATEAPHVKAVVILLEVDEKLGAFEISAGNAHVVPARNITKTTQKHSEGKAPGRTAGPGGRTQPDPSR